MHLCTEHSEVKGSNICKKYGICVSKFHVLDSGLPIYYVFYGTELVLLVQNLNIYVVMAPCVQAVLYFLSATIMAYFQFIL
jgi:hypothetical protein